MAGHGAPPDTGARTGRPFERLTSPRVTSEVASPSCDLNTLLRKVDLGDRWAHMSKNSPNRGGAARGCIAGNVPDGVAAT